MGNSKSKEVFFRKGRRSIMLTNLTQSILAQIMSPQKGSLFFVALPYSDKLTNTRCVRCIVLLFMVSRLDQFRQDHMVKLELHSEDKREQIKQVVNPFGSDEATVMGSETNDKDKATLIDAETHDLKAS